MAATNVSRVTLTPLLVGATGVGASTIYFCKTLETPGAPGVLQLMYRNMTGVFTGLQINLEYSVDQIAWGVIDTWKPLSQAVAFLPIGESGFYRLNCTVFTGGTSFDVVGTVSLPAGNITQSTGVAQDVNIFGNTGAVMDVVWTGATAAPNALQVAGVYTTSSVPILTNGQACGLQCDSNGNLKVIVENNLYANNIPVVQGNAWTVQIAAGQTIDCIQGTNNWTCDITQLANTALGAPTNYGTAPGAVKVLNANTYVTNIATQTSGGATPFYYNGTGGSSPQTVKGSAGQLYSIYVGNTQNSVAAFVNFYNATSPTVGSSVTWGYEVPAGLGLTIPLPPQGIAFGTAITMSVATTASGNTAMSSAVTVSLAYA